MATTPTQHVKPLLCRLNLHHRWNDQRNIMGEPFRRCLKCGKDDPGPSGPPPGAIRF